MNWENLTLEKKEKYFDKIKRIEETCKNKGHIPTEGVVTSTNGRLKVYDRCRRCNKRYSRPPTKEEEEPYIKLINSQNLNL